MIRPKALNEFLEKTNKLFPEINNILYKRKINKL